MKFAHFSHIWAKPGMTPHQRYEQLWRELASCDELGFDQAFCVEHHFRPDESWMSSPSLYAVGAGARTKRLRVGPMGYIVPLYHPLRLAEEIAIVDQMLGGRMELGLVPGINPDYFRPFGLDYGARKSPTLEFVDYLRAAFGETQPFSFHGREFHTDNARISVLSARRRGTALPQIFGRLEGRRLAAEAEHRLLHLGLCRRDRRQGDGDRAVPGKPGV
jgi:alkanesulfonate monooxygenase SsuD/methylene tetrahydromethanopterin reductase-like flavin-dependent oxidoreductase (luciferase family)